MQTRKSISQKESPSQQIDAKIQELGDWRDEMLAKIRTLIQQAVPDVAEAVKGERVSRIVESRDHLYG